MRRGSALIGTLITVAIILVLVVVFMKGGCGSMLSQGGGSPRADGKGKTIPGLVKADAQDDVCREQLAQVRQMIQIKESDSDDKPPESLTELNMPATMLRCPIGHEAYVYDPKTGAVKCPHPGHGKF
ncbi:MAG: hypothetical protein ACYC96_13490 [Fimbriimonadaceae bacterium]